MQLTRIRYDGANKSDSFLAVVLGKTDGKIHCLKSQFLTSDDIALININKELLGKLSIGDRINWCKKNLIGYGKAWRSLSGDKATIEETYA